MNKFIATVAILLYSVTMASAFECPSKAEVEKLLKDGNFDILMRGEDPEHKVVEAWINGAIMITVSYTKPKDNKKENIAKVCIDSLASGTSFNGDLVETLSKSINRTSPKI